MKIGKTEMVGIATSQLMELVLKLREVVIGFGSHRIL